MGKNDKKKDNKHGGGGGGNSHPLARQVANLLNQTSHTNAGVLDRAGHQNVSPILNAIMGMGYKHGQSNMGAFSPAFSDNDAISQAIASSREGYALNQGDPGFLIPDKARFGHNTASRNIVKSLMQERINAGMSKGEARAAIHDELAKENYLLKNGKDGPGTLGKDEQAFIEAKRAQQQQGGQGGQPLNVDPTQLANDQVMGQYQQQGQNEIGQYNQVAQLMGGMVPEQLKPLYDTMVQQRTDEMNNNLGLTMAQMQAYPSIQAMTDQARDWRVQAKQGGSSGGGLNALLAGSQDASGSGGGGVGGIDSMGALDHTDLSRQLLNQIAYGKQMGSDYSRFAKPVMSNSQITYLRDFIPRSNKGWAQVPDVAAYLGATPYGG